MTATNAARAEPLPRKSPPRTLVTATAMGEHLAVSRVYVTELARDGVIERLPDGRYDLDATRLRYLKWLRDPARRSARSEALSEFQRMKTRALMLRIAEREGELMQTADAIAAIDEFCGVVLAELTILPARLAGRDLTGRRKVEQEVFDMRQRIATAAAEKATACDQRGTADARQ